MNNNTKDSGLACYKCQKYIRKTTQVSHEKIAPCSKVGRDLFLSATELGTHSRSFFLLPQETATRQYYT